MIALLAGALFADQALAQVGIVSPDPGWRLSLAVVEIGNGDYRFFVQRPSTENEDGSGTMDLGNMVLDHDARIDRHLSGAQTERRVRVRRLWGHHGPRRYRGRLRVLAVLEHTRSGYHFIQWDTQIEGGRACIPPEVREHYRMEITGGTPDEDGNICIRL